MISHSSITSILLDLILYIGQSFSYINALFTAECFMNIYNSMSYIRFYLVAFRAEVLRQFIDLSHQVDFLRSLLTLTHCITLNEC
jgi:hypothetical protein